MSDDQEKDNVHVLRPNPDQQALSEPEFTEPLIEFEGRQPLCFACRLVINVETRTAKCKRCGRLFDAYEALVYLAQKWRYLLVNRRRVEHEISRLHETKERLERDVRNLKAAKRRGQ